MGQEQIGSEACEAEREVIVEYLKNFRGDAYNETLISQVRPGKREGRLLVRKNMGINIKGAGNAETQLFPRALQFNPKIYGLNQTFKASAPFSTV